MGFFGNNLVNGVLYLVGSVVTFLLSSWLVFGILQKTGANTSKGANWGILAACGVVALVAGYFIMKLRKVGITLLAGWGGVMIGFVITSVFFIESTGAFYGILVACALIVGLLAFKLEKIVIMLMTSFMGSYAIIRGISLYAGGFPDETSIHT
jgi:hypothetical protein